MEIRQLEYFLAIAEVGSFTRAAHKCDVAQPSMSQQIAKLEKELGVLLFDRLPRKAVLSDAGRLFLPKAKSVLVALRDAENCLGDDPTAVAGRLAVGAIPTIAPYTLPHAIKVYSRTHPQVELTVQENLTQNLIQDLLNARIDLAFMSLPLVDERLVYSKIGFDPFVVALPTKHPLAKKQRIQISELEACAMVLLEDIHCLGQQIKEFCGRFKQSPTIRCRMTQLSTILSLVKLGLGTSVVPGLCATRDKSSGCTFRPLAAKGVGRDIVAVWHVDRRRSAANRAFEDAFRQHVETLLC